MPTRIDAPTTRPNDYYVTVTNYRLAPVCQSDCCTALLTLSGAADAPSKHYLMVPPPTDSPRDIPTPSLVAAWEALHVADSSHIPLWAAHWLVQGHDGDALRALAGLGRDNVRDIHELLPAALAECGVNAPATHQAARTVFDMLAQQCLDQELTEQSVIAKVYEIVVASQFSLDLDFLPLGESYFLADELVEGWGRTEPQIAEAVRLACREQLDSPP